MKTSLIPILKQKLHSPCLKPVPLPTSFLKADYEMLIKLFKDFCFDLNTRQSILGSDFESEIIEFRLKTTTCPEDAISLDLFIKYASKRNVQITYDDYPNQTWNTFKYTISVSRIILDSSVDYIEVLSNDLIQYSNSCLTIEIPTNFIILVKVNIPISLYMVSYTSSKRFFTIKKVGANSLNENLGTKQIINSQTLLHFFKKNMGDKQFVE